MIYSMTGFASQAGAAEGVTWTMELRSVNAKGLDVRMRLPEVLTAFEPKFKSLISKHLARGNVNFTLRMEQSDASSSAVVDERILDAYLDAAIRVRFKAKDKGLKLEPSRATDFLSLRGVLVAAEQNSSTLPMDAILTDLDHIVSEFVKARLSEGTALAKVLASQIEEIESLTEQAKDLAIARMPKVAQTLKVNLARVLDNTDGADPDRVAQELAMLSVKADIMEEIDRLNAHVAAARAHLQTGGVIGRKLDFLMQEFNREANTLCSKSNDTDLTRTGLDLKAVIDQMREQVQNVE